MITIAVLAFIAVALLLGTTRIGTASRNAAADTLFNLLNSGTIRFRTSTVPTNVGDADSGTLCATVTFGATAFGAASSGVKTANSITSDTNAAASGTVTQARLYKSDNTTCWGDCSVGTSGADINFDNNVIVAGGTVAVSSLTGTTPT